MITFLKLICAAALLSFATISGAAAQGSVLGDTALEREVNMLKRQLKAKVVQSGLPDIAPVQAAPAFTQVAGSQQTCLATERELFDFFKNGSGGGIMYANSAIIRIAMLPTTERFSTYPLVYRMNDPAFCAEFERAKSAGLTADLVPSTGRGARDSTVIGTLDASDPDLEYRRYLRSEIIESTIAESCPGGGQLSADHAFVVDLTMDGDEDFIIDTTGITCSGGRRSLMCGAQVCSTYIHVFEGEYYIQNIEMLNTVTNITLGNPPRIHLYGHGGTRGSIAWNGNSFRQ